MVMTVDEALNASLSAVMDGHADAADWARVQAAWANDPALRERWRLWQAASDSLHAPELKPLAQDPEALLAALHRQMPAPVAPRLRGREWGPPLAVAASFVALAIVAGSLRPAPAPEPVLAAAPISTPRAQGLNGLSFAQTAAGRTLAGEAGPEVIDWGLALPEPAASRPLP
jgi:negative regulator of sigma E activity